MALTTIHWKRMKSCHSDNMDVPSRYYTKGSKSDRKSNIIWLHLYVEYNKTNRLTNTENKPLVAKGESKWEDRQNSEGN